MKTRENLIKEVNKDLQYFNEDQLTLLNEFLRLCIYDHLNKGEIMKFLYNDTSNIDSAIPLHWSKANEEINPCFYRMHYVYNYQKDPAQLENIIEDSFFKLVNGLKVDFNQITEIRKNNIVNKF